MCLLGRRRLPLGWILPGFLALSHLRGHLGKRGAVGTRVRRTEYGKLGCRGISCVCQVVQDFDRRPYLANYKPIYTSLLTPRPLQVFVRSGHAASTSVVPPGRAEVLISRVGGGDLPASQLGVSDSTGNFPVNGPRRTILNTSDVIQGRGNFYGQLSGGNDRGRPPGPGVRSLRTKRKTCRKRFSETILRSVGNAAH